MHIWCHPLLFKAIMKASPLKSGRSHSYYASFRKLKCTVKMRGIFVLTGFLIAFFRPQANEMPKLTEQLAGPLRQMQVVCSRGRTCLTTLKFFTLQAHYHTHSIYQITLRLPPLFAFTDYADRSVWSSKDTVLNSLTVFLQCVKSFCVVCLGQFDGLISILHLLCW